MYFLRKLILSCFAYCTGRLVTLTSGSTEYGQSHCVLRATHILAVQFSFIVRLVGREAVLLGVVWFCPLDGTAVRENKPHSS